MSDLYYITDIHMITSAIESFGRTAIEAMSRKCVVYSTDAGAISQELLVTQNIYCLQMRMIL